jgi:hypothetical protein
MVDTGKILLKDARLRRKLPTTVHSYIVKYGHTYGGVLRTILDSH